MKNLLKRLLGQSSAYAFGSILTKGIGLLLLPLYTRYLSAEDYGIIAVATVVTGLLGTMLTGGARGSALKFYYEYEGDARRRFYGSLSTTLVFGAGALFLILDVFGEEVFGLVFEKVAYHPYLRMSLWTAYLTSVFLVTTQEMLKAGERAYVYTAIDIATFAVSVGFTVWWVVFEGEGAEGAIRGRLVGAGIVGLPCAGYLMWYVHPAFNLSMIKRAFLYSLPLVPHFLSHWVLSSADRIILERMVPLSDVGVYNVGYQIGAGMLLVATAGNKAIIPLFGNLDTSDSENVRQVARVFTYYMAAVLLLGLCIAFFGKELVALATPVAYHEAGSVVPWVVFGYVFMALYFFPTNLLAITSGRSGVIGIATVVGAVANIGLNIAFIPIFGIYGAAATTTATYAIMFGCMYLIASQTVSAPMEGVRILRLLTTACLVFFVGWSLSQGDMLRGIVVKAAGLFLFPVILWRTGFFNSDEVRYLQDMSEKLRKWKKEA